MSSTSGLADSRYLEGDGSTAEVQLLDQSLITKCFVCTIVEQGIRLTKVTVPTLDSNRYNPQTCLNK
ncbi:hypothetical protein DPMN_058782 [Dreissena polymorpha]|uniref:Uncharacterized protein n=1 Tax=Dreissena polymorpha TaxID=45954 RepID=A0A9D4C2D7_DREPO|nr:hypothetical protein DPMN_058782 [Dreissena polymorpha]